MVTFKLEKETVKQLKKFINGWDTANELLYLHTDSYNNLYLILFSRDHIHISYLKIGNTEEFKGTYQLDEFTIKDENDPKTFKKFISKQKELEIIIEDSNFKWIGDNGSLSFSKNSCDLLLDVDHFLNAKNTFHIKKQDLKVLELYKKDFTCIYFKKGRIIFKIYDNEYNVFAKHIICDNYNNQTEAHCHISNSHLLQLLRKFNSKEEITLKFEEIRVEPLTIESEDYIGILAPRILFEEGYGSIDGLYDNLGDD